MYPIAIHKHLPTYIHIQMKHEKTRCIQMNASMNQPAKKNENKKMKWKSFFHILNTATRSHVSVWIYSIEMKWRKQTNAYTHTYSQLNIDCTNLHTYIHSYLTNDLLEDVANVDRSQTLIYVQIQRKFMCGKWRCKAEFSYYKNEYLSTASYSLPFLNYIFYILANLCSTYFEWTRKNVEKFYFLFFFLFAVFIRQENEEKEKETKFKWISYLNMKCQQH